MLFTARDGLCGKVNSPPPPPPSLPPPTTANLRLPLRGSPRPCGAPRRRRGRRLAPGPRPAPPRPTTDRPAAPAQAYHRRRSKSDRLLLLFACPLIVDVVGEVLAWVAAAEQLLHVPLPCSQARQRRIAPTRRTQRACGRLTRDAVVCGKRERERPRRFAASRAWRCVRGGQTKVCLTSCEQQFLQHPENDRPSGTFPRAYGHPNTPTRRATRCRRPA